MSDSDDLLGQLGAHVAKGQDAQRCISTPEVDAGALLDLRTGRLDPVDAEKLRAHLVACAHCRYFVGDLRPATRKELRHWRGKRARPMQWIALAAVLIAGVGALLISQPPALPPGYSAETVRGGVKLNKSSKAPQSDTFFLPESRISWLLRPSERLASPPAARAFTLHAGALAPLPTQALRAQDGGAWLLDAPARDLLGETFGERHLIIAVSVDPDRLSSMAGKPWLAESARVEDSAGVTFYSQRVVYRADMPELK